MERFKKAQQILGFRPDISYNNAVCYYKLRQYDNSLKHIADIIEKGIKEHPGNILFCKKTFSIKLFNLSLNKELSVGMQTDGIEVASVGNTIILHESCLVEAFNLKSAIQFNLKNCIKNFYYQF